MQKCNFNRRELLRTAVALGAVGATGVTNLQQVIAASVKAKTPPMSESEMKAIDVALGKKGKYVEAESVYTTALPRNDLKVSIKNEPVPVPLGFGGWVAFKKTMDGKGAVVMSDTVLLQEEVNPLISAAHANNLEVSAIHNHFFYEEPRIFYMHLRGMGDTADIARRYAAAIKATKLFPANQPAIASANAATQTGNNATPAANDGARTGKEIFDLPALDRIVGHTGAVNGPTYKYTVGRDDLTITAMGAEMTAAIGLNSWAAFAGERDAAHVAGDIAMLEAEVNPVIMALRRNNLEVVAVHNHMLGENPRIVFLHYYGRGAAATLAQGFRAALNELGKGKSGMRMSHGAM